MMMIALTPQPAKKTLRPGPGSLERLVPFAMVGRMRHTAQHFVLECRHSSEVLVQPRRNSGNS